MIKWPAAWAYRARIQRPRWEQSGLESALGNAVGHREQQRHGISKIDVGVGAFVCASVGAGAGTGVGLQRTQRMQHRLST
eukprot:SAG11_NODE_30098_length_304_cov_0.756098_1_plen_79_part_10